MSDGLSVETIIATWRDMLDKEVERLRTSGLSLHQKDTISLTLTVGTSQPKHLRDLTVLRSWYDEATVMVEDIETHPLLVDFAGAVEDALRDLPRSIPPEGS